MVSEIVCIFVCGHLSLERCAKWLKSVLCCLAEAKENDIGSQPIVGQLTTYGSNITWLQRKWLHYLKADLIQREGHSHFYIFAHSEPYWRDWVYVVENG